ncbi:MAG: SAM-dependent methyltransferase [Candidatus Hydrothermarchaeota archaeon]|jgi:ribosome biogenesis SPOUT family RNA methylase Rps3|nr:SAM-dependent methyltransferase [Candidatus Hydrothermarchaeota archaeon]
MAKLVIDNCEPELSEWLYLEYKHAAEIWGSATFTNVTNAKMARRLIDLGRGVTKPFHELYSGEGAIILDPRGEKTLQTKDFNREGFIVIGGILGEAMPNGRTEELISIKSEDAVIRNLGEVQLTIDSAALVAKLIQKGMKMRGITVTREVELRFSAKESVVLPYGYVVVNRELILTPGLRDYLLSR